MSYLITPEKESEMYEKLVAYYRNIYPGVEFRLRSEVFTPEEIGGIYYTFPGEENIESEEETIKLIESSIRQGYSTPAVVLENSASGKVFILDGHRRLKVAFKHKIPWELLFISCSQDIHFGLEKTVIGKIKDLFIE